MRLKFRPLELQLSELNYQADKVDDVTIKPILMKKGCTKVAKARLRLTLGPPNHQDPLFVTRLRFMASATSGTNG